MSTRCPLPVVPLPDLEAEHVLAWSGPVVRIYPSRGRFPASWSGFRYVGPIPTMRFDHHLGRTATVSRRGISYGAVPWASEGQAAAVDPLEVAVLECFPGSTLDRFTNAPRLSVWTPTRPLRLLQLSDGRWLPQAHGNAALTSGARGIARAWSRAIYQAYRGVDAVDGLVWSSSVLPGGRAIALYERAQDALPAAPASDRLLSEPFLQPALARIARTYAKTLI